MTKNSGKKVSKESEIFQRKNLPIADQWTDSIFRFSLLLVVLIGLLELIISTLAGWSGSFGVGRDGFLVRYFFIPTGVNVILYLGAQLLRSRLSSRNNAMLASALLAEIVINAYTVHSVFPAIFIGFAAVILCAGFYGDIQITSAAFGICLIGKLISDLFFEWDKDVGNRVFSSIEAESNFFISILCLFLIYVLVLSYGKTLQRFYGFYGSEESDRNDYVRKAMADSMTGLRSRESFRLELDVILKNERIMPCCLAMINIDQFRIINDTYGRKVGDDTICLLAEILDGIPEALAFRYNGDAFSVLFPGFTTTEAGVEIRKAAIEFGSVMTSRYRKATISAGLAEYLYEGETITDFVHRVEQLQVRAKKRRNSICLMDSTGKISMTGGF